LENHLKVLFLIRLWKTFLATQSLINAIVTVFPISLPCYTLVLAIQSKESTMPLPRSFSRLLSAHLLAVTVLFTPSMVRSATQNQGPPEPSRSTGQAGTSITPSTKSEQETTNTEPVADSKLRLGIGDLVEINVYNVPELAAKVRVSSSGDVYLPLIDYVHVAGLATEEAQALIEKRLSDGGFLKNPHVSVFVDEYASQGASVLGEVAKPGVYPVLGEQRLFDLISAAGGFTEKAGRSVTVTHRNQSDKPVTVPLYRNISDNPESNVEVFPGDTVIVRKADIVYVVGDVGHPSGFLMDSGNLTVLKAIALAGGTNRTAKLNNAKILRKGPAGVRETPVPLKKMLEAKAPDVTMEAEDILFVPSSSAKIIAGRTLEAAMQAATAVSVVAIRP
jgi:polysaccharide biosynthesis/export protein